MSDSRKKKPRPGVVCAPITGARPSGNRALGTREYYTRPNYSQGLTDFFARRTMPTMKHYTQSDAARVKGCSLHSIRGGVARGELTLVKIAGLPGRYIAAKDLASFRPILRPGQPRKKSAATLR